MDRSIKAELKFALEKLKLVSPKKSVKHLPSLNFAELQNQF